MLFLCIGPKVIVYDSYGIQSFDMCQIVNVDLLALGTGSKVIVCHAVISLMSKAYIDPWDMPTNFKYSQRITNPFY